jgi:hypothetical protein
MFFVHPLSGVLMIENLSSEPIVVRSSFGATDIRLTEDTPTCILFEEENHIVMGDMKFMLEIPTRNDRDTQHVQQAVGELLHARYGALYLPFCRPLAAARRLEGDILVHSKILADEKMAEFWGVHRLTGDPVSLYRYSSGRCDTSRIQAMIQFYNVLSKLKTPATGIIEPMRSWCSHSALHPPCCLQPPLERFQNKDSVWFCGPLVRYNFATVDWTTIQPVDKLAFLHQTLMGVMITHDTGFCHGNIRLQNLALTPEGRQRQPTGNPKL